MGEHTTVIPADGIVPLEHIAVPRFQHVRGPDDRALRRSVERIAVLETDGREVMVAAYADVRVLLHRFDAFAGIRTVSDDIP